MNKNETPYPPSWMDRISAWIDRLTISAGQFYFLAGIATSTGFMVLAWLGGGLRVGEFHYLIVAGGFYTVLPIVLYRYLSGRAGEYFDTFKPILQVSSSVSNRFAYGLQQLPARWGWIILIFALAFGISDVTTRPESYLLIENSPLYIVLINIIVTSFNGAMIFALVAQIFRQLRFVHQMHRLPLTIDLFNLDIAHTFSKLTARIAGSLILLGLLLTAEPSQSALLISFYVMFSLLGLLAFFVPLRGMYGAIRQKKNNALQEINGNIASIIELIQAQVGKNKFPRANDLNTTLTGLVSSKSIVEKIPPWPWDVSIFRSFVSSILLPILLWFVFRVLDGVL